MGYSGLKTSCVNPSKNPPLEWVNLESGSEVFSQSLSTPLLSPLLCLTTEFGMGSGRTTTHQPPGLNYNKLRIKKQKTI
jgi:hypothetical protein